MRTIAIAGTALLLGVAGTLSPTAPTAARAADGLTAATQFSAASNRHHRRAHRRSYQEPAGRQYRAQPEGQIACTPLGCGRIPPNCHPTTAYYDNGTPTGYDAVACR